MKNEEKKINKWNDWLYMTDNYFNNDKRIKYYPGLTAFFLNKYSNNIVWEHFSNSDLVRLVDLIYNLYIREIKISNNIIIKTTELVNERLKIKNNSFINYYRVRYSKKFIEHISKNLNVKESNFFYKNCLEDQYIGNILLENGINFDENNFFKKLPQPIMELYKRHVNFMDYTKLQNTGIK